MKKLLFFITLFCSNVFAHTNEYLYIGSASYHFNRDEDLNEINYSIGYNKHGGCTLLLTEILIMIMH